MAIRITTLSENTASSGNFLGEWGLSILVETEEVMVLLDAGKSYSMIYNAGTLGIDFGKIEKVVLSHGHYDHTGGLRELLRRMRKGVDIIAHPDIWQAKYTRREGEADRYVGIPFQQDELESLGGRFRLASQPVHIADDLMTTGQIPMVTSFEEIDAALFVKDGSIWKPDKVMDDQALIVKTKPGLAVILGCAHRGIINTLYHAQQLTGTAEIHTVIGGSHLLRSSEERLWQTIAALRELDVQRLGLCHCTDLPAASLLAQEFREKFFFNKAGTIVQLP
jgi:7,8-dihydropterin-6-yl-methyl-4-(beta-D-ribofuranosyl)aminobenzene 5'-phosphate synthase